ncbi:MAG: hypothetical protein HDR82_09770 [Bacteroides sp.]|nr:hypothetical protein [Bacteroides sp.]
MAQITTLKDKTGTTLYPVTSAQAVFDDKGVDLETRLQQKQDTITTPDGNLALSPDGQLTLTDLAKKRLFIDLWNQACGIWGKYNEETGYFELNGINDIDYQEALRIHTYCEGWCMNLSQTGGFGPLSRNLNIRTAYPITLAAGDCHLQMNGFAQTNNTIEVIRILDNDHNNLVDNISYAFYWCSKLKHIYGHIICRPNNKVNTNSAFTKCNNLETLFLKHIDTNLVIKESSKLSLESFQYLVKHGNTQVSGTLIKDNPITITVHPDVYAKLTDSDNTEWHQILLDAAEKNITFVTV